MPEVYAMELFVLSKLFRRTQERILTSISGPDPYNSEEVHEILDETVSRCGNICPELIKKQFKKGTERRSLSVVEVVLIGRMVEKLLAEILSASITVQETLDQTWRVAEREARYSDAPPKVIFDQAVQQNGIIAFADDKRRTWGYSTYCDMITRTTARQTTNLGTLYKYPDHDLYRISSHATTCPICAPLEGRVYSRSGLNPNYPPLAMAFGKIDPGGPDDLSNTWLNIHPNCLHVMLPFDESRYGPNELRRIREFSNPASNPITYDPRPAAEQRRYRNKERGRQKLLNDWNQFERYRVTIGPRMPKTFQTFLKHKIAGDDKYKTWQKLYREANKAAREMEAQ